MAFSVADRSAVVADMAEAWPMIEALCSGTSAMRKAGKAFLPQWPAEDEEAYKARLDAAVLFPAYSRTTEVLAAKPLSKPITIEDVPPAIEELFEDIDRAGSTLHQFAGRLMLDCLRVGLAGVLVDCPSAAGVRTVADERAAGVRPYLAYYPAKSILGWRVGPDGALSQLRLMESVTEPDGDFGDKSVAQIRVLEPGRWSVYREARNERGETTWEMFDEGETTLPRIPFVFFHGVREAFGVGRPPLVDLAHLNVAHWQSSSDQAVIEHIARVPILFAKGFGQGDTIKIGAGSAVQSSSADSDLKYVEHTGAAIGAGRQSLLGLEDRMRQTGAELLVQRPNVATATQTVSEGEGSRSILQRIAEGFDESLEECLRLMGEWVGLAFEPEVQTFKDFGATGMSQQASAVILQAVGAGVISPETAFEALKRRDIIDQETDWEEEQKRLASRKASSAPVLAAEEEGDADDGEPQDQEIQPGE